MFSGKKGSSGNVYLKSSKDKISYFMTYGSRMILTLYSDGSVQNLEIIEPMQSALRGTNCKKRSLFHMLKTTRIVGG